MRRRWSSGRSRAGMVAVLVSAGVSAAVSGPSGAVAEPPRPVSGPGARAASAAAALVADRPQVLLAGPDDGFVRQPVQSSMGWQYVPFERTYRGLPVLGGDFVVVVDPEGDVSSTSVAQQTAVRGLDVEPAVTRAAAERVAAGELAPTVALEGVRGSRLVVDVTGAKPRLAWESTVAGRGPDGPSLLEVVVDAVSGTVVRAEEQVLHDAGHSGLNGGQVSVPSVRIDCTTGNCPHPGVYQLGFSPSGLSCNVTKTFGPEAREWGNGDPAHVETACVDATHAAIAQLGMLANWLGRSGMTGNGSQDGFRIVLEDDDTFYHPDTSPPEVHLGRSSDTGAWFASLDIVGHENGHGIDHHTPGGFSHHSTAEFVADAFGVATEWYANRSAPHDTPDYVIGDTPALGHESGRRYMYHPALDGTSPNCYSSAIPSMTEPHAAAGVGNHWLYLLAEGSNPTNGQPASPTCNGSGITGIGLLTTMRILYHAMLMKNSNGTYPSYRTWTLTAARNLFPHDCSVVNSVRKAWDAVSVPAQPGEPACVPHLSGVSQQEALARLAASSLAVGSTTSQLSTVPAGTVLGQSPAPWSSVPVGTPVNLTLSLGRVQVPHVFHRTCADASNLVRAAGLVPSCTGAGPKVTDVSPLAGAVVPAGSLVTLTLSTVRHVPDVVGVSCATATGWLAQADLGAACSGSGPVVTRQSPGAGIAVTVGAVVQLSTTARPRPPGCPDAGTRACPRPGRVR